MKAEGIHRDNTIIFFILKYIWWNSLRQTLSNIRTEHIINANNDMEYEQTLFRIKMQEPSNASGSLKELDLYSKTLAQCVTDLNEILDNIVLISTLPSALHISQVSF